MSTVAITTSSWVPHTAVLRAVTGEIAGVATYDLQLADAEAAARYRFLPGQFNMLYLPGVGESAISLSGNPASPATLRHTIRVAGNVTRTLARLRPGDTLGLRGPFGSAWPTDACLGRDVVVAAGGIGLAPLRPLIEWLLERRDAVGRVTILYGGRSPNALLFARDWPRWVEADATFIPTVDRAAPDWHGHVGVTPLLLDRLTGFDPATAIVVTCGPEIMMTYVAKAAQARGVSADRIYVSLERNMQCAVGLCGHCQFGPEFVCRDGPVFRYDRVAHWMRVEGL